MTFSGNGEPTLYPHFAELVPKLKQLISRIRPSVQLALLSNSSTVSRTGLHAAFDQIDLPIFKLDAGDQATFEALNRPCPGIRIEDIVKGLTRLATRVKLVVQTVICPGPLKNWEGAPFEAWVSAVKTINPTACSTLHGGPAGGRPAGREAVRRATRGHRSSGPSGTTGIVTEAYY